MDKNIEKNLGTQPIAQIMAEHNIRPRDVVRASTEQISHKMVSNAAKGRRLSPKVKSKILCALNNALEKQFSFKDLFNY